MKLFNILVIELAFAASARASDMFDWYLERVGPVDARFGDVGRMPNINLTYEIAQRRSSVQTFEIDCLTPVQVGINQSAVPGDSGHYSLNVGLYIDQASVASSAIWRDIDDITGMIELCVRVDLFLMDDYQKETSYNFDEQKLYVTIDLTQDFDASDVDIVHVVAPEENANAQTDYGISFCQCNQNSECTSVKLVPGDAALICINTSEGSGVEISAVQQLEYTQSDLSNTASANIAIRGLNHTRGSGTKVSIPVIANGKSDGSTRVKNNGQKAVIESQLPSNVFDPANRNIPLVGSGTLLVRFGSGIGDVRNLRFAIDNSARQIGESASRMMQDQFEESKTGFTVSMDLSPLESEEPVANTAAIIGGSIGGGIALVVIIGALVLIARRKNEADNDDESEDDSNLFA